MLKRVTVENYRSLEGVRVDLAPLTALVGPNGSGKSSILRAIDFVLGQRWPSLNRIDFPRDFTGGEDDRALRIAVRLAEPLTQTDLVGKTHEIHGFQVSCKPYKRRTGRSMAGDPNFDYEPLAADGKPPQNVASSRYKGQPVFAPLTKVTSEMREAAGVLFIDHRRSLREHQPWARGSILARLLAPARKELTTVPFDGERSHAEEFSARYQEAMDALRTPQVREIENTISRTTRRALGFLGSATLADLDVRFGFADPANPFETLRLNYHESGLELPADELGSGVQSAIVVGIFEAFRQLGTDVGTVLIEEPEMYLHPQAQRYLHAMLCELVEKEQAQVIYSTHSPVFADLRRFEALRLVRREPGQATTVAAITKPEDVAYLDDQRTRQKLHAFTSTRSELLFARRVLLVEGPGDALAARLCAEKMPLDLDAEDFSVVECGSKNAIPFFAKVCQALGIAFAVLHDEDVWPLGDDPEKAQRIEKDNAAATHLNEEISKIAGDSAPVFLAKPTLEAELGISRHADHKPMKIVDRLDALPVEQWPEPLPRLSDRFVRRWRRDLRSRMSSVTPVHFGGRGNDWQEAEDAIRDILFLYRDLTDYYGIVGDHDTGSFEAWKFLNCTVEEGYGDAESERLLHQGAAIALLSEMIDWWTQGSGSNIDTYRAAVDGGRFDHLPAARAAVAAGLEGEEPMIPFLDAVYEDYVLAYFENLSRSRRPA